MISQLKQYSGQNTRNSVTSRNMYGRKSSLIKMCYVYGISTKKYTKDVCVTDVTSQIHFTTTP